MFTRTYIQGSWKHKRWKNLTKNFSTLQQKPSTQLRDIIAINTEITRCAKEGHLGIARQLFDEMPKRTVVSWNTLLTGYSKWGLYNEALSLVYAMHNSSIELNETTLLTTLSVCAHSQSLRVGEEIHCLVLKSGFESFELVGSTLVYFYASCSRINEARNVFDELCGSDSKVWCSMMVGYVQCNMMDDALEVFMGMPCKDVLSWTTLISGFSKVDGGSERALQLFKKMVEIGEVMPNEFTLDCVLRVCGRLGLLCQGRSVHGFVIKCGFEHDEAIGSALVDLYCSCQVVDDGRRVFDELHSLSLNVSNSLIGGYISMGKIEDAELIFSRMEDRNPVSYNMMIKGYALSGRIDASKELFEKMPMKSIVSINTMISVYSEIGEIENAQRLFESAKGDGNSVTWNSMISGLVQNDHHEEAIKLYMVMHKLSIERTRSTFSTLFHACSCLGSLQQGRLTHAHLIKTPFQTNVYVGTSLVDMYAKCGSISDAETSFNCIYLPNVAAWTALINGYAHHGLGSKAYVLFQQMLQQGIDPNGATFVGILSACARTGLVKEGMQIFQSMEKCYSVSPTIEHYACVVDLLGRAGHLLEAEQFINDMQIEADAIIWGTLLGACWFWMNMEVGQRAAIKLFTLDSKSTYAHIIASNIYARFGRWAEKMRLRNNLRGLEEKKDPGCSWIEFSNRVHTFSVEDRFHPHSDLIHATLDSLTKNVNQRVQLDDDSTLITDTNESVACCFNC